MHACSCLLFHGDWNWDWKWWTFFVLERLVAAGTSYLLILHPIYLRQCPLYLDALCYVILVKTLAWEWMPLFSESTCVGVFQAVLCADCCTNGVVKKKMSRFLWPRILLQARSGASICFVYLWFLDCSTSSCNQDGASLAAKATLLYFCADFSLTQHSSNTILRKGGKIF